MMLHITRVNLPEDTRTRLVSLLNANLASLFDLYSQTKQAHWNVKGPNFIALHELFDELAAETLGYVDMVAERITALGGMANGTVRLSAAYSSLPEFDDVLATGQAFVQVVADRVAGVANAARTAIDTTAEWGDAVTADLLTEVVRGLDKQLYFLEAHLR